MHVPRGQWGIRLQEGFPWSHRPIPCETRGVSVSLISNSDEMRNFGWPVDFGVQTQVIVSRSPCCVCKVIATPVVSWIIQTESNRWMLQRPHRLRAMSQSTRESTTCISALHMCPSRPVPPKCPSPKRALFRCVTSWTIKVQSICSQTEGKQSVGCFDSEWIKT